MKRHLIRRKFEETLLPEASFAGLLIVLALVSIVISPAVNPVYMASQPGLPPMISTQVTTPVHLTGAEIILTNTLSHVEVRGITVQAATFYDHCGNYMVNIFVNTTIYSKEATSLKQTVAIISDEGETLGEASENLLGATLTGGGMLLTVGKEKNEFIITGVFSFMGYIPNISKVSVNITKP